MNAFSYFPEQLPTNYEQLLRFYNARVIACVIRSNTLQQHQSAINFSELLHSRRLFLHADYVYGAILNLHHASHKK